DPRADDGAHDDEGQIPRAQGAGERVSRHGAKLTGGAATVTPSRVSNPGVKVAPSSPLDTGGSHAAPPARRTRRPELRPWRFWHLWARRPKRRRRPLARRLSRPGRRLAGQALRG